MAVVSITCPPSQEAVAALDVGDLVYLSGDIVVTGGLPAHKRMIECLDRGLQLPLTMEGVFIHLPHMIEARPDGGYDIQYVNPTTSRRFDAYMPQLIRNLDLRIVGGKAVWARMSPRSWRRQAASTCRCLGVEARSCPKRSKRFSPSNGMIFRRISG